MGRYTGKTCRLLCMIALTASFFLVEIIVGYITNSLALVGDSYHMLSDVIALIIGFASVRISKWRSRKNTYGWARAEVLGALINAVFLVALCFTIFIEALQRIVQDDHIHNPDLMLIVGGIGLGINLIGLALFGSHGHSHGGHGHSHGGGGSHSHGHEGEEDEDDEYQGDDDVAADVTVTVAANGSVVKNDSDSDEVDDTNSKTRHLKSSAQLNMRAVFLHVMGDALGSVIVIVSALVLKYVEADWKHKVDPAMSMVLVIIILSTSIPLLRESALILLQTVPTHIKVTDLKDKLMTKVEGVMGIHEFHIWQLAGNRIIASAHIRCQNLRDYMRIAEEVKLFFHNEGIHSTTIQPEFIEVDDPTACLLDCPRTETPHVTSDPCEKMKCCPEDKPPVRRTSWLKNVRRRKKSRGGDIVLEVTVDPADEKQNLLYAERTVIDMVDEKTQTSRDTDSDPSADTNQPQHNDPNADTNTDRAYQEIAAPETEAQLEDVDLVGDNARTTLPLVRTDDDNIVLNRPQSMISSVSRTSNPELAACVETLQAAPSVKSLQDNSESARLEQSEPEVGLVPAFTSAEALDQNILRLKQDWKAIRGDMASRESVLDH